ncbi:PA3496 family putative envelope integrity protein [Halotalea alkalilenta]|uniref:Uncharacterized protein n=1 Tax=Halotalea alkalilenta TaxID=376489 RepID=A0A172YI97_9GAMM|nr:hypothetical protein [Halotalea alkalilenta]ANF58948.1 hypothetical protein A5892_16960 [Halotalea alkalilenta]
MSSELYSDQQDDGDDLEAVNDEIFAPKSRAKSDPRTRRRVEALLEERRLQRLIEDSWDGEFDEEE